MELENLGVLKRSPTTCFGSPHHRPCGRRPPRSTSSWMTAPFPDRRRLRGAGRAERLKAGLAGPLGHGSVVPGGDLLVLSHAHPDHMGAARALLPNVRPPSSSTTTLTTPGTPGAHRDTLHRACNTLYGKTEGPVGDPLFL